MREDERSLKSRCDPNCKKALFQVFDLMDQNGDNLLDLSDLDQLDEEALVRLSGEVKEATRLLGNKQKSGVEDMRNVGWGLIEERSLIGFYKGFLSLLKGYYLFIRDYCSW